MLKRKRLQKLLFQTHTVLSSGPIIRGVAGRRETRERGLPSPVRRGVRECVPTPESAHTRPQPPAASEPRKAHTSSPVPSASHDDACTSTLKLLILNWLENDTRHVDTTTDVWWLVRVAVCMRVYFMDHLTPKHLNPRSREIETRVKHYFTDTHQRVYK